MKRVFLILLIIFCMLPSVDAKQLHGKWKAQYEYPDSIILLYPKVKCKYTFKDDGSFMLKLKGKKRLTWKNARFVSFANRTTRVKVRGKYKIANGTISTFINPKDAKSRIYSEVDTPDAPDLGADEYSLRRQEHQNQCYNQGKTVAEVLSQTVKEELGEFWEWHNLPIVITNDTVKIGGTIKLYR